MRKLVPVLALLLLLNAGMGASDAQALSDPASTALRNLSQSELKTLIADIDAQGLNTTGSPEVKRGIWRMQSAANVAPKLVRVGSVAVLGGTAAVIGWKIGAPAGAFLYKQITGETYGATMPSGTSGWYSVGSDTGASFSTLSISGFPTLDAAYFAPDTHGWVFRNTVVGAGYCLNPVASSCGFAPDYTTLVASYVPPATTVTNTSSATCTGTSVGTGECAIAKRTAAQMEASVAIDPIDSTTYAGITDKVEAGSMDTSTPTDPELEAALDAIDPNPGSAGSADEEATAQAILEELDPGWDTMTLPQPTINETYTAYIARLEALGWIGTATTTVLSSELQGYGPLAPARITYNPGSGTRTLDPLRWPTTAPTLGIDTDITIRYNPSTAAEAPGTDGETPTQVETPVSVPPTTVPTGDGFDFTPISDIDFGCKFPYGIFCYAIAFTEIFDVAPDAPVFSFTLGWTGMVNGSEEGGTAPYEVDLTVLDSYMSLWRSILSVCLWVGAVYWVASRFFGFNAAGDPGEAIDDVL